MTIREPRSTPIDLDPETFRRMGHRLVDDVAALLDGIAERRVAPGKKPSEIRALLGPPGIPADRLRALRDGFVKMMKDPDVIAEAKSKGLEPSLMTGEQVEALGREIGTVPADVIGRMKPLLEKPA